MLFYFLFKVNKKIVIFNFLAVFFIILESFLHGFGKIDSYLLLLAGPNIYLFFRYSYFSPDIKVLRIFFWLMFLIAIVVDFPSLWGVRGVSGLYNEPSHMARYLIVAAILISLLSKNKVEYYIFPLILINKSATLVVLYLASLMSGFNRKIVTYALVGLLSIVVMMYTFPDIRFSKQLFKIYTILNSDYSYSPEVYNSLGSRRLVQSIVGYSAIFNTPLGVSDSVSLIEYSKNIGFDISKVKRVEMFSFRDLQPGSYLSEVVWYFGTPAFLFFAWWSVLLIKSARQSKTLGYSLVGILMIMLLTTSTMLAPWLLLGVLSNNSFKNRIKE